MRLFILLLFTGLSSYSQKIELASGTGYLNSSLDTLTGEFRIYFQREILTLNLEDFKQKKDTIIYGAGIDQNNYPLTHVLITVEGKPYFVHAFGGLIYTFSGDTLKRIDNSFNHKMQFGATIFEHEGIIFKYGGYGFWSVRDFFTYFDKTQLEWDVFHPINSKTIPKGSYGAYHVKMGDELYIFGGVSIDEHNRRKHLLNDEVWHFDFKNKQWAYKGVHQPFQKVLFKEQYDGKHIMLHNNLITLIDIKNNTRETFRHSPVSAQVNGANFFGHYNSNFYMTINRYGKRYLYIIDEDSIFGEKVSEEPFYKNSGYWFKLSMTYAMIAIILAMSIWLVKHFQSKRNRIILLENGLRYKNKYTEFDKESMSILRLLLAENEVPSGDILRLVEKEQYSPAHNERIKVQKINDINLKVATLSGINYDLISSFKSPKDRRIRLYKLVKDLFGIKAPKNSDE